MSELMIKVMRTHKIDAPLLGHLFKEKSGFVLRAVPNKVYGLPVHDGDTLIPYTKGGE